jgi:transketolase
MIRKPTAAIFGDDYRFRLFGADVLRPGRDITLLATGILVRPALDAAEKLFAYGISAEVINVHTIKPIDAETVVASVRKTGAAVTCENHNVIGGLRSAVAEAVTETFPVPIRHVGFDDCFGEVQRLDYLMKRFHLTADDIVEQAVACLAVKHCLAPALV